jgi:flagellar protein FlaI
MVDDNEKIFLENMEKLKNMKKTPKKEEISTDKNIEKTKAEPIETNISNEKLNEEALKKEETLPETKNEEKKETDSKVNENKESTNDQIKKEANDNTENKDEQSNALEKLKALAKSDDSNKKVEEKNISENETNKEAELEVKSNENEEKKSNEDVDDLKSKLSSAIKKDEKLFEHKDEKKEEPIKSENIDRSTYHDYEDDGYEGFKKVEHSAEDIKEFNWEKRDKIEEPKVGDFDPIKDSYVEPDPSQNLNWLKDEVHGKDKQDALKIKEEKNESIAPNKSSQKISAPSKEEFASEIKKEKEQMDLSANNISSEVTNFEWENDEKIEEPKASDFSSLDQVKEEVMGRNKGDVTNHPKWIHKNDETKNTNNKETNETYQHHPKWKHIEKKDKTKVEDTKNLDENNVKNPKEKVNSDKKETNNEARKEDNKNFETHPKWKHSADNKKDSDKPKVLEVAKKELPADEAETGNEENSEHHIKTPIDQIFEILEKEKKIDMGYATTLTNTDYYTLERIIKTFEDYGIVDIKYPASLNKKPKVILLKEIESKIKNTPKGKIMEHYEIVVDNVPAHIKIINSRNEARPVYGINMPHLGKYTRKFLEFIKNEIAETIPIETDEILDPKKSKRLKERFFEESQKHLKDYFTNTDQESLNTLSGIVMHEMYGLGDIEIFLGDDMLEEIAINSSKTPMTVYHRVHGWLKTNFYPGTEEEISNYSSQIGRKVGREITTLTPILDAHLLSGDRVNATLFPISSEGNTITIRRFARRPWTLVDFIGKSHTMNTEIAALLWLAMQYELNIIVSGGTASGKTSTLNTLLSLVPPYHRIISIEDVREIVLPKFLKWNWIPMVTRSANPEGLGEVTMLDCMVSSLRMRPDRIIVGEIRRKKEAEVMMEAIETGHSIYSTIHANSAYQVLRRLGEAPMSIPPMQIELIDIIVTQFRDRKTNKRRTYEVAEIEQTAAGKGLQINTIYKWSPRTDEWDQLNKPNKLLTLLNLHTGLTENEVQKDLDERKKILNWLVDKNINDLNEIGFVIKKYYIDKEEVLKMADDNLTKEQLQEMIE